MTAAEVVSRVRAAGLSVEADGEDIVVRPRGRISPELRAALVARKGEVLKLLRTSAAPLSTPPCAQCGSTTWVASLVDDAGRRTCAACVTGATALRRAGASL